MKAEQGHYIVVEGLEGAGKSTAINTIKQALTEREIPLITTREPGGTQAGEQIRHIIKDTGQNEPLDGRAELLLMYAARIQLVETIIKPALQKGTWVLADRFELSSYAYQGGGRKIDIAMLDRLSEFSLQGVKPDLVLFLDIDPETGLKRALKRSKADRIEQEALHFFHDVYEAYHQRIKMMDNVRVINAGKSYPAVQRRIRAVIENYLVKEDVTLSR